jgi:hypothetical protein
MAPKSSAKKTTAKATPAGKPSMKKAPAKKTSASTSASAKPRQEVTAAKTVAAAATTKPQQNNDSRKTTDLPQAVKKSSAKKTVAAQISPAERMKMIAEAAYFMAAKRGFSQGNEMEDWVSAQRQVDSALNAILKQRTQ